MRKITPSLPIGFESGYLKTTNEKQLMPSDDPFDRRYGYLCLCQACGCEKWVAEGCIKWRRVKSCGCMAYELSQEWRRKKAQGLSHTSRAEQIWVENWCRDHRPRSSKRKEPERMSWELDLCEIADESGNGTTRWRMVARSAEQVRGLCTCGGGHATLEEARDCDVARKAALALFGYEDGPC